ncbi:MAG: CRISPR-associated helicase Cas3' [Frankiaceae bacterium]|jgi:CRISPR-associated endonuclease/helicase Cas3|nr:CRISPR-associated helicase Cas3' [Frankiaceae bacterium]
MTDMGYAEFFRRATGHEPHGYQRRVAERDEFPALVDIPPGYGKTAAIVLAWLWRRRAHPDPSVRGKAPRRLVYALPQRTLTDQVARETRKWLDALGLESDVRLHVLMGGLSAASKSWRSEPEADSILIGTVDMLVSKSVVRAYGVPRHAFPMDAALVWNDAHVVIDEIQGAPASTVTLRQIEAFRVAAQNNGNRLTCMSATAPAELLDTVDSKYPTDDSIVRIGPDDVTEDLLRRRAARRAIRHLDSSGSAKDIAQHVYDRHRRGRLTLVIVNTVKTAKDVHRALKPQANQREIDLVLLHSQFRPVDRKPMVGKLSEDCPPDGRIVVATQVVEAGIDIDADVLVTELAPWSSVIQRSGRCNRRGQIDTAEFWWLNPATSAPYESTDLETAAAALASFDGRQLTNEELLDANVATEPFNPPVLRRSDFFSLFDTSADLSGHDLDVAPYIRDTEDLSVQLCWANWPGTAPPEDFKRPQPDYRCRIPVGEVKKLVAAGKEVWHFDPMAGRWQLIDKRRVRPGEVLVLKADQGGYREETGFDPSAKEPVDVPQGEPEASDAAPNEDETNADSRSFLGKWVELNQHLVEAAEEAAKLVAELDLSKKEAEDVVLAARLHDIGKAHPIWQDALCRDPEESEKAKVEARRPWAKSAKKSRRLLFGKGIPTFRHELASLLLLDGPLHGLLTEAHDPDLVRYLVLAHHGKLRVQLRDPKPANADMFLGFRKDAQSDIPSVLEQPSTILQTPFNWLTMQQSDGAPLWPDVVAGLIERHNVFRLAYLEMLVRIADWRSSALHDEQGERT